MITVRPVNSANQYLSAFFDHRDDAEKSIPVIGDWTHRLSAIERLTRASVKVVASTDSVNQLDPRILRRRTVGSRGGGGPLVIALSEEAAVAAIVYANLRAAEYLLFEDENTLQYHLSESGPATVAVFALPRDLKSRRFNSLRGKLKRPDGRSIPWGLLTGFDLSHLTWAVLKSELYAGFSSAKHLLIQPGSSDQNIESPAFSRVCGHGITEAVLRSLPDVWRDLVAVESHGDQVDVFLGKGYLCGRIRDYTDLLKKSLGERVPRCFYEDNCYRSLSATDSNCHLDGVTTLIPADSVAARVLMLNACAGLLVGYEGFYELEASYALSALGGLAGSVVVSDRVRSSHPFENLFLSALLRCGVPLGEAVALLNDGQENWFPGGCFVLLGDPETTLNNPNEGRANWVRDVYGGFDVPASPTDYSWLQINDSWNSARLVHITSASSSEAIRAYALNTQSIGTGLLLLTNLPPLPETHVEIADPPTDSETSQMRLESLLQNLRDISIIKLDAQPDLDILHQLLASWRTVLHQPPCDSARLILLKRLRDATCQELNMMQRWLMGELTQRWAVALRGDIISIDERWLLYGSGDALDFGCSSCEESLISVSVMHAQLPSVRRRHHVCRVCNLVADLPWDDDLFALASPKTLPIGQNKELQVTLRNDLPHTVTGVIGAAVLGARGHTLPVTRRFELKSQQSESVRIKLYPTPAMVPGRYYLKVACLSDLRFAYRVHPVSIVQSI